MHTSSLSSAPCLRYAAIRDSGGLAAALNNVSALFPGTTAVSLQGHSAGGAIATLMSFDLARGVFPGLSLSTVTTFGSPRVGNEAFFEAYSAAVPINASQRVTHYHDMVPHVPQTLVSYHHVAREVYFDEPSAHYTLCDGSGEDSACSNSCSPLHCTSTEDHLYYLNVSMGGKDKCVPQRR